MSRIAIPNPSRAVQPTLRFTPTAWAKLLFLRDYGDSEVGGFGIAVSDDLLLIEDIQLVKQDCSWANVAFDDESVADFFDAQVDTGRRPEQFARIWVHTHPGDSPRPSMTDEATFARVFGRADWAVMFILAREGDSYARLRFNVGPRADLELPISIDYSRPFSGCDFEAWTNEYLTNVVTEADVLSASLKRESAFEPVMDEETDGEWRESWFDYAQAEEQGGIIE